MRRTRWWCGALGVVALVVVWMPGMAGRAAPGGKQPDEAKLRSAKELRRDYERLYEEGRYGEAIPLAELACSILEEELGKASADVAGCLNNLGLLYNNQGLYEKAQSSLERALSIFDKVRGKMSQSYSDTAIVLGHLGELYRHQGAHGKAEALLKRALSTLEKELGPDHPDVAMSLNNLATLYVYQGAYGKAEPLFRRALSILEKELDPNHPDIATSLDNLAALYGIQGAYRQAEPLCVRALSIREEILGSGHPDVATSLANIARLYSYQDAYRKAEPLYERALAIREKALGLEHPDVATSLNDLARLLHDQGAYGRAELLYKRALSVSERALGRDHPDVALSSKNLGELYREQGAYGKAEPLLERALTLSEGAFGPDHPSVAESLRALASLYHDQGAYEKSKSLYERALSIYTRASGQDHSKVAGIINGIALLYRDRGEYEKSESLLKQALSIYEKALGRDTPRSATIFHNLAVIYHDQGKYDEAESLYKRALSSDQREMDENHPLLATSLDKLATLYSDKGAYEQAELLLRRALSIREKVLGQDHALVASSLSNLAVLYHEQGRHGPALELQRRALDIDEVNLVRTLAVADELRRRNYATTLSERMNLVLSLHAQAAPAHELVAELALTTLLSRKGRVGELVAKSSAALRHSLPQETRPLLDDLADVDARIAVLASRGPNVLTIDAFTGELDELRKRRDHVWSELATHSALVAMEPGQPAIIREIQETLFPGHVLIELIRYLPQYTDAGVRLRKHESKPPTRYGAYLLYPDHFDWLDLGPAEPIEQHTTAFRRALQLQQPIPTDLHDAVMQPILDRLPDDTTHLIIAPDGALNLIPFGALYDGHRYLIEKYTLRYVTTGRDLLPRPPDPVTTTPVTVVANPLGADRGGTELEADFLSTLFPDARVLQHADATETNVRTVEHPLVLHMATHGFFGEVKHERDNPMLRSGILLADVDQLNDPIIDRELDDGQLTAYEVSGWDLRGTQLVVLSACETALGELHMGEGVLGLRRAFAMAGAQTQVMSLWHVGDVTAQKVMESYYLQLAQGRGRGGAMQDVQLQMLRTEDRSHPHHWAAFVVTGDDAPMQFPAGQEPQLPEPDQPPPVKHRRSGCNVAPTARDDLPLPTVLLGLVGLPALRRRRS